ncbi:TraB/GumN family protein [Loktanella sp. Alg231-35]|uniref:TraB/GumN family protein n=1 Tax=Loktanella sp. Alg231-35 TaxID=1922220 RepID=UPI000D560B8F|nr:TraB/GumN family protein [Loktanella sp. Alg231-35]
MFLRTAVTALFALTGTMATAACTGVSYLDQISDAQRMQLDVAVADMPFAEGLVWKATKSADTVTVIGTMHIYDPRLEALRATLTDTITNADLVMLEATPEEEDKLQDMIVTDPGRLFIVDGPTLPEMLDSGTWDLIADAASQRSIPPFMAAKMQPWYLSLMLAVPPCAMEDMVSGVRGLDQMIIQDAEAAGVPMQAVEPFTTLFDIFKNDSIDEQVDMLRVNMLSPAIQQQMFVAMLDRYFAEDVGRLWELSRVAIADIPGLDPAEGVTMFAEMQEALLETRNRNWIPVILAATETHDDIVVAVGAAHLIGDQGVLQLMQNDGWTLTRVTQ